MKPTRLKTVEFSVATYYHEVPVGTTFEDILDPTYWAHVAAQLRPKSRIVCDAVDGTWTATLFVRAAGKVEAFVAPLSHTPLNEHLEMDKINPYKVEFLGANSKWAVTLSKNGKKSVLSQGHQTGEIAYAWAKEHIEATRPEPKPEPKPAAKPAQKAG